MSDENEKITDSQLAEENSLEAEDTATATDDQEQVVEDSSAVQPEVDEVEVEEVEEPAVIKSPPKKEPEPEEEMDPVKRALLPKKPDTGPVVMDWYILKVQSNRERSIAEAPGPQDCY